MYSIALLFIQWQLIGKALCLGRGGAPNIMLKFYHTIWKHLVFKLALIIGFLKKTLMQTNEKTERSITRYYLLLLNQILENFKVNMQLKTYKIKCSLKHKTVCENCVNSQTSCQIIIGYKKVNIWSCRLILKKLIKHNWFLHWLRNADLHFPLLFSKISW